MGEKSGGLTNMIIVIIALVAIVLVVDTAFPTLTETVTSKMQGIVESTFSSFDAGHDINPS